MVTVDLNIETQWVELFRRVEGGETLRITRGEKEIAIVCPTVAPLDDAAYLQCLAEMGARQIAEAFPPHEFADWEPKRATG